MSRFALSPGGVVRSLTRALVAAAILLWLGSLVAVLLFERRDTAAPSSAIVVLGAAQYAGHPSPVLRARLDHALVLWNRHLAPRVIVTGGRGDGDTLSEASVGARYLRAHGVPATAILSEQNGRTSEESMEAVAAMLVGERDKRVILVSDPFHMLRLDIIARKLGLDPRLSPTPRSRIAANRTANWRYRIAESVKVPIAALSDRPSP